VAIVRGPDGPSGGAPLYIQVDGPAAGAAGVYDGVDTRANPAERVLDAARDVYGDGLALARRLAEQAADSFAGMPRALRPAEIEMQLAIKLDASLGAVLVQTGAEAQLQVTFRWTPGGEAT
jgi:hypothetical protein